MANTNYYLIRNDGAIYEISSSGLSVGRHRSNEAVVSDRAVSRHHARVVLSSEGCLIQDLNSTGGTFENGQHVLGQQEMSGSDDEFDITHLVVITGSIPQSAKKAPSTGDSPPTVTIPDGFVPTETNTPYP